MTRFRSPRAVRYNCDMPNAFRHAVDLAFFLGLALFGRSILQNSKVLSTGLLRFCRNRETGTEFSPQSCERLGSACFVGGLLAVIAYLAVISLDLLFAT